jgi:hypothetical protein
VAPRLACATLGPTLVAAVAPDDELLEGAWDQLEGQYRTIGASAQKRALKIAGRMVGGFTPDDRRAYGLRQAADLDDGWAWMKEALGSLAKARLYAPDLLDPELGEFDPTSRTPTGLVRQAMRVAGGVKGSANVAQISTSGLGSAWISVPDGSAPGGIATGALIEQIVKDEGGSVPGYRWVYGPADRTRPFLPHLHLDGLVFASFTDPLLVIGGSFPTTGHYIPGDHRGCICDVEPIFLTPEQVAQLQAEGRLPKVAPPPPPPPDQYATALGPHAVDLYGKPLGPMPHDNYGRPIGPKPHDLHEKPLGPQLFDIYDTDLGPWKFDSYGDPLGPFEPDLYPEVVGPTKAPPKLARRKLGPKLPTPEPEGAPLGTAVGPVHALGAPRWGVASYDDAMATVRTGRTGQGRGFAYDGPDVESMHVHTAPVSIKRTTKGVAAEATEYRFKLTDQGAAAWREAILPSGDAVNRRNLRPAYGEPRLGFSQPVEARKAAWKEAGWSLRKGVRVPDPGIAAELGGRAEIDLGKVTTIRNKEMGGKKVRLNWAKDDGQQARWQGKVNGRNVTIEYSDVAANDRTATALHNEVRIWVEGADTPSEDYFAALMEQFRFTRRVGVPTDAEVTEYAERALINKLGTAEARKAVYARSGGGVGYDPATATQAMRLSAERQADAITEALADIRARFGIGPEDLQLATSADGRSVMQLTDGALQRLVDETGVTFFTHSLHHSLLGNPSAVADMLTGEQGGLLSSRRRMGDGLPFGGLSADRDFETGGADFVFTRHQNAPVWRQQNSVSGQVVFDNDRLRDLDWFSYRGDYYGQTHLSGYYGQVDFVAELREGAGRAVTGNYGQETMFKDNVDFRHMQGVYLSPRLHAEVMAELQRRGVTRVGARELADVIKIAGQPGPDVQPVHVPGGRPAGAPPTRADLGHVPGKPLAAAPPATATSKTAVQTSVDSIGPTAAISMIEGGAIDVSYHQEWAAAIGDALEAKYGLGSFDAFGPMVSDYGFDIGGSNKLGATIIKALANKHLDAAEAEFIKTYTF